MVFTREKGRIGGELRNTKEAIYHRNYRLKNLEKKRKQGRKSAKKFYDKNRADKIKLPNFLCIICKSKIEDNPKGRRFKCIECKFREQAKRVRTFEDRKFISRIFTNQILGYLKKDLVCEKCKEQKKLEFHHKIYPLTAREIKQAYQNKKIIPLCRKHHIEIHKCINTNIQNTKN